MSWGGFGIAVQFIIPESPLLSDLLRIFTDHTTEPQHSGTRTMPHNRFLSVYLILFLLPSLYSCFLRVPLLNGYKKLDPVEKGDPETLLLADSSADLQAAKPKSNRGNVKSLVQTTKGAVTHFFAPKSRTPDGQFLMSWEVCYDISHKASESPASSAVQELAQAVLTFGPRFDLHEENAKVKLERIMSTINLFSLSLEIESLRTAERVWAVGVLSYLRSQIPEETRSAIPALWTAHDLHRPREEFLLFFLKEKKLERAVRQMWSEFPNDVEPSEHVIKEKIQRESVVHLINKQIDLPSKYPSTEFQKIYLDFINLKTPISWKRVPSLMQLMRSMENRLRISKTQDRRWLEEESSIVRMLLHLVEYHYDSFVVFKQIFKTPNVREIILTNAVRFQLEDDKLDPVVRNLLVDFGNKRFVSNRRVSEVLNLIEDEQISIPQLGRLFRVIDLARKSDRNKYPDATLYFTQHSEMIPKLYAMIVKYRYGRMNPKQFWDDEIQPFVFTPREEKAAENYRNGLANLLISRGVLTDRETIRDSGYLSEGIKKTMVTATLYGVFKRISDVQVLTEKRNKSTDYLIAEYILYLISFKNNDKILYRHLLVNQHAPEKVPKDYTRFFKQISDKVFRFIDDPVWRDDGQSDAFARALKKLETSFFPVIYEADRSQYQSAKLPI